MLDSIQRLDGDIKLISEKQLKHRLTKADFTCAVIRIVL